MLKAAVVNRCKLLLVTCCLLIAGGGCDAAVEAVQRTVSGTGKTFHEKFDWRAENFFSDTEVIALCRAIEESDLEKMNALIAAGADVNRIGKDVMTCLLSAFPEVD